MATQHFTLKTKHSELDVREYSQLHRIYFLFVCLFTEFVMTLVWILSFHKREKKDKEAKIKLKF